MAAIFLLGLTLLKTLAAWTTSAAFHDRLRLIEASPAAILLIRMRGADGLAADQAGFRQPFPDPSVRRFLVAGPRAVDAIGWFLCRNRGSADAARWPVRLRGKEGVFLHLEEFAVIAPGAAIACVGSFTLDRDWSAKVRSRRADDTCSAHGSARPEGMETRCPRNAEKELHYVFPTGSGNIESRSNIIKRGFLPTQVAAGVAVATDRTDDEGNIIMAAKYGGMHALRHFYASWSINRPQDGGLGLPPKMVQERLGHSSITMTMDTYGHLFPRADEADEMAAAERSLLG